MTKRKNNDDMMDGNDQYEGNTSEGDDCPSDDSVVNVEFEFFDPKEQDFHNIKNFSTQYFGPDKVDTSDFANLIISQPLIGTTIKPEGDDDAYAIFTVLNMNIHQDKTCIQQIKEYLLQGAASNPPALELLKNQLSPGSSKHLGLIFNERLINMPVQVVPPMYRMLGEEIEWAIEDKEPYEFEYLVLLSKTYKEVQPQETSTGRQESLTKKKNKTEPSQECHYVNLEDAIIVNYAEYAFDLRFNPPTVPDSKRTFSEFGIVPGRKAFIIHNSKYSQIVESLSQAIGTELPKN